MAASGDERERLRFGLGLGLGDELGFGVVGLVVERRGAARRRVAVRGAGGVDALADRRDGDAAAGLRGDGAGAAGDGRDDEADRQAEGEQQADDRDPAEDQ